MYDVVSGVLTSGPGSGLLSGQCIYCGAAAHAGGCCKMETGRYGSCNDVNIVRYIKVLMSSFYCFYARCLCSMCCILYYNQLTIQFLKKSYLNKTKKNNNKINK